MDADTSVVTAAAFDVAESAVSLLPPALAIPTINNTATTGPAILTHNGNALMRSPMPGFVGSGSIPTTTPATSSADRSTADQSG